LTHDLRGNAVGEIGGLTTPDPASQAEVQALRDACEELADDVRALAALVNALRGAVGRREGGEGWSVGERLGGHPPALNADSPRRSERAETDARAAGGHEERV